eukprot:4676620-Lingulodinium_polyedra.AAC.1
MFWVSTLTPTFVGIHPAEDHWSQHSPVALVYRRAHPLHVRQPLFEGTEPPKFQRGGRPKSLGRTRRAARAR